MHAQRGEGRADTDLAAPARRTAVLRLLGGETVEAVSRELGVPGYLLADWRRRFLEAGTQALRPGTGGGSRSDDRAWAKIGELTLRLDLARRLLRSRGMLGDFERLWETGG